MFSFCAESGRVTGAAVPGRSFRGIGLLVFTVAPPHCSGRTRLAWTRPTGTGSFAVCYINLEVVVFAKFLPNYSSKYNYYVADMYAINY